jgi:type I restriction enzyme S subunit
VIDGLKPYPRMKDSGVPWLGRVPDHWRVERIKNLFREVDSRSTDGSERLLSLRAARGLVDHVDAGGRPIDAASLIGFKRVSAGELVMNRMRAASGLFAVADKPGIVSPDYAVFRPVSAAANAALCVYLFKTPAMGAVFRAESKGLGTGEAGFLRLYTERFGPIAIPSPPSTEQVTVLRFIERADRLLRRFIATKQKLTAALSEQRQAVVEHAVLSGLSNGVRLRSTGNPWFPTVPAHWEFRPLKRLLREVDDRSTSGTETLLSLRMHRGLVPHNDVSLVRIAASALVGFKRVSAGQVVMNRMRAAIGLFGLSPQAGLVSPDYAVFDTFGSVCSEYLLYLLKSRAAGAAFRVESKGLGTGSAGFMRLYTDRFGAIKVPLPPVSEQLAIVKHLAKATASVDSTIQCSVREVSLLRELRTRLICDVVTGKLDVREVAANLPEGIDVPYEIDEAVAEEFEEEMEGVTEEVEV